MKVSSKKKQKIEDFQLEPPKNKKWNHLDLLLALVQQLLSLQCALIETMTNLFNVDLGEVVANQSGDSAIIDKSE